MTRYTYTLADGRSFDVVTDRSEIDAHWQLWLHLGSDVAQGSRLTGQVDETAATEHGYGLESDCTCGRNFTTVRGLREHLTKARGGAR